MEKTKNSTKLIFLAVLCLLAAFLIVLLYIVPKATDLKDLSQTSAAKQSELEVGQQEVAAIRSAAQLIKAAKTDMDTLGVAIPDQQKAEEALVQLSTNATASDVAIKSTTVGTGKSGELSITVAISGDFSNTVSFLGNLEKNLRPVKVVDFSMTSSGQTSGVDSTFDLSFPYLTESDAATENTGGENGQ